jgi:transcriptional regulator with XRE-family HTH domain
MPNIIDTLSRNLRYSLYKEKTPKGDWSKRLGEWMQVSEGVARSYLTGKVSPKGESIRLVCDRFEIAFHEFSGDLLSYYQQDILKENLPFLFDGHGKQKEFQEVYGVDPSTTSKWVKGKITPSEKNLERIKKFFGLPSELNLKTDPLFLEMDPVGIRDRKKWVQERLEDLSVEEFSSLYPALRKMVEEE